MARGYCEAHTKQAPRALFDIRRRDDVAVKIRRSTAWRKVSEQVRRQQPLCGDPLGKHAGFPEPVALVHHITAVADAPDLALVMSNLASVCIRCHASVEAMHRAGTPTAHLFIGKDAASTSQAIGIA